MMISIQLHVAYLRSLEASERVRTACLAYLQNWYPVFYPERPDLVAELQALAQQLQGHLEEPRLLRTYAWIKPLFGWKAAKSVHSTSTQLKASCIRHWDKAMYRLEVARAGYELPLGAG